MLLMLLLTKRRVQSGSHDRRGPLFRPLQLGPDRGQKVNPVDLLICFLSQLTNKDHTTKHLLRSKYCYHGRLRGEKDVGSSVNYIPVLLT